MRKRKRERETPCERVGGKVSSQPPLQGRAVRARVLLEGGQRSTAWRREGRIRKGVSSGDMDGQVSGGKGGRCLSCRGYRGRKNRGGENRGEVLPRWARGEKLFRREENSGHQASKKVEILPSGDSGGGKLS